MSDKLHRKLNKTKKGNRTKKALTAGEVKRLLIWLKEDRSLVGLENYALVFMFVSSGLRAAELCQLTWGDMEYCEGTWTARFIKKGSKEAEQELYGEAVEACLSYSKKHHSRDPKPEDALFGTTPSYNGDLPRPLPYHTAWTRIKQVGEKEREAGIIKRDITFSPHLFRRTYATCLYRSGMKIKAIQEKTRHASIETLIKHYIYDEEAAAPYLQKAFI